MIPWCWRNRPQDVDGKLNIHGCRLILSKIIRLPPCETQRTSHECETKRNTSGLNFNLNPNLNPSNSFKQLPAIRPFPLLSNLNFKSVCLSTPAPNATKVTRVTEIWSECPGRETVRFQPLETTSHPPGTTCHLGFRSGFDLKDLI